MSGLRRMSYGYGLHRNVIRQVTSEYKVSPRHNLCSHRFQHAATSESLTLPTDDGSSVDETRVEQRLTKLARIRNSPDLKDFMQSNCSTVSTTIENVPYLKRTFGNNRKVYFDVYGCQMNVNDTEIIWSILQKTGFQKTNELRTADVILLVTCAIREGAEQKIWNQLEFLESIKRIRKTKKDLPPLKIGLLGCMAERLKHKLLEETQMVDLIAGPDSYKDLPRLLELADNDETAINVILSFDETYADVAPVRLNKDAVTAFVSIMRGCDNMCTYCIVPFTRGRERSRPMSSIINEVSRLSDEGVKEVTLLGQNVNSYRDTSESSFCMQHETPTTLATGFKTVYKPKQGGLRFSYLLDKVSLINPNMRIRFTSPHPKDFPDEVLNLIAERPNICRNIHLPAQSGNSKVLERMRRGYTREAYLELVEHIRDIVPDVALSSDFICGFCGETEDEFEDTLSLLRLVKYNMAYLFAYSMREKTTAHRRYEDNIHDEIKMQRLRRMISVYRTEVEKLNQAQIGQHHLILVEGRSKRSEYNLQGKNSGNTRVIIPAGAIQVNESSNSTREVKAGDYVVVQIHNANSQVLKGIPLYHASPSTYVSNTSRRYEQTYS